VLTIRQASSSDTAAVTRLCGQLGYPADEASVNERFHAIDEDPHHAVFVAEDEDGSVVGWIHVMPRQTLLSSTVGELGGLVVDERGRRKGVGAALVAHAEEWALQSGYKELVVRSDTRRSESHSFYPALGFEVSKDQRVYRKSLS
jgi:N-acetylglutamate synthase-like GNAT family acetyltransferase